LQKKKENTNADMNCQVDHIVFVSPTLKEGTDWIGQVLGVEPSPGGQHPGTLVPTPLILII